MIENGQPNELPRIVSTPLRWALRRWNTWFWGSPDGDQLGKRLKLMSAEKMRIPALNAVLGLPVELPETPDQTHLYFQSTMDRMREPTEILESLRRERWLI